MYLPDTVRPQNAGYGEAGASWRKRAVKGFNARSGSAHEDIDFNNYTLRQRARMLYMAAPIATSAIKINRTNVVGVGLRLKSRIDRETLGFSTEQAEAWQKKTEREFRIWAQSKLSCDATGMNNFYGLQQLVLTSWLLSGDCVALVKQYPTTRMSPYSLRIHLLEADRVATPGNGGIGIPTFYTTGKCRETQNTIYDGVEVDGNGMVVAYHIRNTHPFEMGAPETEWKRIPAYQEHTGLPNVIHVMNSERPDQYRGVSYLAQIIEPLLQLRRYTESELMAAMVQSFLTAFISVEGDTANPPMNQTDDEEPGGMHNPNDYSMGPGQINIMRQGESVNFTNPTHPVTGFNVFTKAVSEQMGAALEIPSDLLTKSFNASYSASRAALLEAWKTFRMYRQWLADDFCAPVYEIWMSEAVARGRIFAPGFFNNPAIHAAYMESEWLGPSQGQLDPVKEITAEILACSEGFSTHEQSTIRLNGGQWDANVEQLQRENEKLGGQDPDPHQREGDAPFSPEGDEEEEEAHRRKRDSLQRWRGQVIRKQIEEALKGD